MSFLRRLLGRPSARDPGDVYAALRSQVLTLAPEAVGPMPEGQDVCVAVMDWNLGQGIATLVAVVDGTVSLYVSSGGGVIGAGQRERPRRAADAFLAAAHLHRGVLQPATELPLPAPGHVSFHIRTLHGNLTATATTDAVRDASHPLAPLFATGQDLLTALRELG